MSNLQLQSLIEEILGSAKSMKKGNVSFFCPFCHHHKRKLEVNLITFKYHCWVCDAKGWTIWSLFKRLDVTDGYMKRLRGILGDYNNYTPIPETEEPPVRLPSEFISLSKPNPKNPFYRNALSYATSRGIKEGDILKYNIGYCDAGQYSGRLIIPSYDSTGKLNYFVGRSYQDSDLKYKNPPISRDIIGFENLISWAAPIVLVEGVMDAIAVGRNAIPMFGKYMSLELRKKIVDNKIQCIYVALDPDALDSAIKIGKYYYDNEIEVHVLEFEDSDPSEMGHVAVQNLINNSTPLNMEKLIQLKLR